MKATQKPSLQQVQDVAVKEASRTMTQENHPIYLLKGV